MSVLRVALGLAAAIVLLELAPPRAEARVAYPPAQTLSAEGGNADAQQVAVDPQGGATVVWSRFDGADWRIQAVRLGADGAPGPVQGLSAAGESAFDPQVTVDSQGRATVVWRRFDGANFRIQARRYGPFGLNSVQTLSVAGQDAHTPQVAIDSQDRATVVWRRSDGANWRIQAVRLDPTPGTTRTLSAAGQNAFDPQVAIDSQDRAIVVWRRTFDGTDPRIQTTRLRAADSVPDVVWTLSAEGKFAFAPQVAVDTQGRATFVWKLGPSGGGQNLNNEIQAYRLSADFSLSPGGPKNLTELPPGAFGPQVAVDSQDRATVVWQRGDGSQQSRIEATRLRGTDGAPEGPLKTLSATGGGRPQVAVDSQDRVTVVWRQTDGTGSRVQAVRLGADGAPGPVQDLSAAAGGGGGPKVAVDSQGRATVVWRRSDGANVRIEVTRGAIVAPDTEITSGPAEGETIADPSPTFSFVGAPAEDADRFECSVDGGPFATCASPHQIGPLADGPHSFAVRAVDVEGDADPTPAQRSFTVDTTPPSDGAPPDGGTPPPDGGTPAPDGATPAPDGTQPDVVGPRTRITRGPKGKTRKRRAAFRFRANKRSTFQCRLTGKRVRPKLRRWRHCGSAQLRFRGRQRYRKLRPGKKAFRVRATDRSGNLGKPAVRKWRVRR